MVQPWREIHQAENRLKSAQAWLKEELAKRGLSGQQVHKLLHPLDKSALIRQGQVSNIRQVKFGLGAQDTIEKLAGNEFYQAYRVLYPPAAEQHEDFLAAQGLAIGELVKANREHTKCGHIRRGGATQARAKVAKTTKGAGAARTNIHGSSAGAKTTNGAGAGARTNIEGSSAYATEFSMALSELTPTDELTAQQLQNESLQQAVDESSFLSIGTPDFDALTGAVLADSENVVITEVMTGEWAPIATIDTDLYTCMH